jgi:hypothetical protein
MSTDTRSDASSVLWVIVVEPSGGLCVALAVHQDGHSQGPGRVQTSPGPAGPRLIPLWSERIALGERKKKKGRRYGGRGTGRRASALLSLTFGHGHIGSCLAVTVYGVHHKRSRRVRSAMDGMLKGWAPCGSAPRRDSAIVVAK